MKNIFLLIVLFFISACAELNLVNHISKKVLSSTKNEVDNNIYKTEKEKKEPVNHSVTYLLLKQLHLLKVS